MKEAYGDRLSIRWRYFSLEQVNNQEGPHWKLWEQPEGYRSKGLLAFQAAEAARCQGPEAFQSMHFALLRARHERSQDLALETTIMGAAQEEGLDLERFRRDLRDRSLLKRLGEDHREAVEKHGIFGTPTLIFQNGLGAYLKMKPPPPPEEAVEVFESLYRIIAQRPYIIEVKRPR
ncbi:MAG: thioredoxin domain-containing protein [Chloroflexi bacterium]|nr:thioredoxin domain-containing protein [Chloroflexota bacterium]